MLSSIHASYSWLWGASSLKTASIYHWKATALKLHFFFNECVLQSREKWSEKRKRRKKTGTVTEVQYILLPITHLPKLQQEIKREVVKCYTMIARAAVLIALVPSAGAFLPPAVGRHSSALRAQASQVVQVEEKPGSFMRDEVTQTDKWIVVDVTLENTHERGQMLSS